MTYRIPKKIALINSIAGYGRCSATEAIPILSAMKVQACPVPTSIFSNHTGFSSHYCEDFTAQMTAYLAQWEQLAFSFDGIYCGFLGNEKQIGIVADFIAKQRQRGCSMVLIDPVMGDHGKCYKTVSAAQCIALRRLVALADIITPNITEACILTDTPYKESGWQEKELKLLCQKLHACGPQKIAVTGLHRKSPQGSYDSFINFVSEQCPDAASPLTASCITPTAGPSRHGTGDIFASILAADAVNASVVPAAADNKKSSFSASVEKAASFISTCIHASDALGIPEYDGVCFENFLDLL